VVDTHPVTTDGIELRILGDLEIAGADGPIRLRAAKERLLLAVLAVYRGRPVSRDGIVEALWRPGRPPPSAVNAAQNYVLRVRRALRPTGLRIATAPGAYRLELAAGRVDADIAERLIADGRSAAAAGEFARAAEALRAAVELWRGPSLGEFAQLAFAEAEARRLDELCEAAREDLVDAELAAGRHRAVVGELRAMVARCPLRERRWAQLMLALHRDDRQADALETYRSLRAMLADELGIEPGPALVDLNERILRHDPALAMEQGRAVAAAAVRPGTFVGRAAELRTLTERFAAAARGQRCLATVVGEPGIGKTSLLRAFAAAAGHGAAVLAGCCVEGDWQPACHAFAEALDGYVTSLSPVEREREIAPFADVLVRLVPRLCEHGVQVGEQPVLAPDEDRMRLLDGVARFVTALSARKPVLLVLDDLHWADASTLVMLRHVARVAAGQRLMIVTAYRADEAGPHLRDTLGALRTDVDTTSVRLCGLDSSSIGELLGAVAAAPVSAALVDSVESQTRGNPFFARELIRHLLEEGAVHRDPAGRLVGEAAGVIPEGVRQVLARRRARLSGPANLLLEHAAAFAGPFPFAVVARAADLDEQDALTALDAVLDAGVVEPSPAPDRYRFGHALIRHAVLGDLNPSRRLRMHRKLAQALAAARIAGAYGIAPAEVAAQYHASAALPGADAGVRPAVEAADEAEAAAAHAETATFLRMAAGLAAPDDDRLPAIMMRLGLAEAWAGRFDACEAAATLAAERLAATAGPDHAADYLAAVASALASADSAEHAWRLAGSGLRYIGGRRDRVWASLTVHDLDRREAADPEFPGMTLDDPRRREALATLLADRGVAGRPDLARLAVSATYLRRDRIPDDLAADPSVRLFVLGDYRGALPLLEAELAEAGARGRLALQGYYRTLLARAHAALGRLAEARAGLAAARGLAGRSGTDGWGWQRVHDIGTLDAIAHATDTGWTDVLMQIDEAYRGGNAAARRLEASAWACGAKAAARLGRREDALRRLAAALPALRRAPAWAMNYLRTLSDVVETLWLVEGPGLHRHPDLAMLEEATREKALRADFRFPMMDVRLTLARLCALEGRCAEAEQWLDRSRAVLEEQQAWPLRAIVDLDSAVVARRDGRPEQAAALRAAAVAAFERLGMIGWVHRAGRVGGDERASAR
jgi:DNA-binding SARP family transcriptional activator